VAEGCGKMRSAQSTRPAHEFVLPVLTSQKAAASGWATLGPGVRRQISSLGHLPAATQLAAPAPEGFRGAFSVACAVFHREAAGMRKSPAQRDCQYGGSAVGGKQFVPRTFKTDASQKFYRRTTAVVRIIRNLEGSQ
jgi:hypothetical protein